MAKRSAKKVGATLKALFLGYTSAFAFLLVGLAGIALPIGTTHLFPPVPLTPGSTDVLAVIWQVEAAALALTVALILFLFESLTRGPLRIPLRDSVQSAGLLPLFNLGVTALVVDGVVLIGFGRDSTTRQWPLVWAISLTMLAILSLFLVFVLALLLVDVQVVVNRLKRQTYLVAREAVDQTIYQRVGNNELSHFCQTWNIAFDVFLAPPTPPGTKVVRAGRRGIVVDIDLWELQRLARLSAGMQGAISLRVKLGDRVAPDSVILAVPSGIRVDIAFLRLAEWT